MKLAEGLIARADAQKRLARLRSRIAENARYQEGDTPPEDPQVLLGEAEGLAGEIEGLIRRINRTNIRTRYDENRSLTDVLAERDALMLRRSVYADAAKAATGRHDRWLRTEIRLVAALDVAALQRRVDELSKEYRELDIRIQELNWATELEE